MDQFNTNDFFMCVGRRRSGKSYFTKNSIIPMVLKSGKRLIILDFVTNEYGYLGLPTFSSVAELKSRGKEFINTQSYRVKLKNFRDEEELTALFEIIDLAGNAFVIFEEAAVSLGTKDIPVMTKVAFGGRHGNIGMFMTTQRPRRLPSDLISQSVNWFIFKITDNYDLIELKKKFGHFDISSEVKALDQHEFLTIENEDLQGTYKV